MPMATQTLHSVIAQTKNTSHVDWLVRLCFFFVTYTLCFDVFFLIFLVDGASLVVRLLLHFVVDNISGISCAFWREACFFLRRLPVDYVNVCRCRWRKWMCFMNIIITRALPWWQKLIVVFLVPWSVWSYEWAPKILFCRSMLLHVSWYYNTISFEDRWRSLGCGYQT